MWPFLRQMMTRKISLSIRKIRIRIRRYESRCRVEMTDYRMTRELEIYLGTCEPRSVAFHGRRSGDVLFLVVFAITFVTCLLAWSDSIWFIREFILMS